jgi:tRNA dimethylallyltransferase
MTLNLLVFEIFYSAVKEVNSFICSVLRNDKILVVIAGPTAVGKTAVALHLAKQLDTDIVSADSRQLFREMNIGTAKPSEAELSEVKHYMINSQAIDKNYDAAQFARDALEIIKRLFQQKRYVILCGGSGLYIKAVCEGFDDIPEVPDEIREELIKKFEHNGIEWLQQRMLEIDPEHFETIDQQNPHRLIRALEVKIGTGQSIASFRTNEKLNHNFSIVKIGLELPRDILYQRIDERMDKMIADGLFEEARSLYPFREKNALQTVGYQEVFDFMEKKTSYEEAVSLLKRNSRRYAKRQLTWFKRDTSIKWFNPGEINAILAYVTNPAVPQT